ncbi:unnamed protein product [Victoria cruziana]
MDNSRVGPSDEFSNKNHANPRCHHSPTPPANATAHTGASDSGDSFGDKIDENNQETVNHRFTKPMGPDYHASAKISKHFRGPTASAASAPKKKILGENGEILNCSKSNAEDEGSISSTMYSSLIMPAEESFHESTKAGPHQSNPAFSFSAEGTPDPYGLHSSKDFERITSSVPYDPVNNYLTPRPQYLRYKPNRRLEWALSNRKHPDDKEQSVSDECDMDQIEKNRNFSEDENLCILSSGDESSENYEGFSEYNQGHTDTSPTKDARESPQDEDDDDDYHCKQVKGSSSRPLRLASIFVLILGGFSLWFTDWPAASTSHTFPDKIIFQAKYVARSLKETSNYFQFKCLKLIENRNEDNQREDLQVLAGYLCAVLYPHGAGYEAQFPQSCPALAVETMGSHENSSHISSLEDETPPSMYHERNLEHVDGESDDSSRMTTERGEPMDQEPSLLLGSAENATQEHDLPKSSEPLEVVKDDDSETGAMEYEPIPSEAFEFTKDVGDSELTGEPDTIVVVDPEIDQIISQEEYENNNNEEQVGIDNDNEIRDQRSWLLKNKAKGGFVVGTSALAALVSTIFCISYRRRNSRGGAGDVGASLLSCEKEAIVMESARSPERRTNGVLPPRAVGGENQVAQTGHQLATSSVCCNEVGGANLAASSKGNHDVASSLYSSKVAEAKLEVSSGRRYRKKTVTTSTNNEAVSPPSENSAAASFSYGSFYSQEKLKVTGDEETVTPVRRSSRLRKQVHSPR